MTKFIKTNWPLITLTILATLIMAVIVDKKRNELPKIREEIRFEKIRRYQENLANQTNVVTVGQE